VPECVDDPALYRVRAGSGLLSRGTPWVEGSQEWIRDEPGLPVASRGHVPLEAVAELEIG
jgi:hypothetical protein